MADLVVQQLIDACDQYADRQHVQLDELLARDGDTPAVPEQRARLDQLDAAVRAAHYALLTCHTGEHAVEQPSTPRPTGHEPGA